MQYSPELTVALRKWRTYVKKYEKYNAPFFYHKKEKWWSEVSRLYRQEWKVFRQQQREVVLEGK